MEASGHGEERGDTSGADGDGRAGAPTPVRRHRGVRTQCLVGRGHVRPVPDRSHLGVRVVARVLRRLPAGRLVTGRDRRRRPAAPAPAGAHRSAAAPPGSGRPAAPAPTAPAPPVTGRPRPGPARPATEEPEPPVPLRGAAGRIVANMEASLGVPTATSVRIGAGQAARGQPHHRQQPAVPDHRRQGQLHPPDRLRGGQGAHRRPGHERRLRRADADGKGTPGVIRHRHVGLGSGRRRREVRRQPHPAGAVHHRGRHAGTSAASWAPTRSWCARSTPTRSLPTTSPAPR